MEWGSFRWDYALPILVIHMLAFLALLPWFFSWTGVIVMQLGITVFGQLGVPICYHRLLTHRSFRVPKWLERSFVTMALCCAQDSPARWVVWHRRHHQHSDEQDDPHSPLVAFLWSHVGWLVFDNSATMRAAAYDKYARDILQDPFYLYLEKHRTAASFIYLAHAVLVFLVATLIGWAVTNQWADGLQFGLSLLVWGVIVRTVYVWHITWAVNSLSHLFGYRNYETSDHSRNNWFVAIITGGEGWHNNHHHDPTSASVQHHWYEFDLNYYIIKALEWIGLATHVVPPRHQRRPTSGTEPKPGRPDVETAPGADEQEALTVLKRYPSSAAQQETSLASMPVGLAPEAESNLTADQLATVPGHVVARTNPRDPASSSLAVQPASDFAHDQVDLVGRQ